MGLYPGREESLQLWTDGHGLTTAATGDLRRSTKGEEKVPADVAAATAAAADAAIAASLRDGSDELPSRRGLGRMISI
jgi:hypothetical protein